MKLGLLQCGHPPEALSARHGSYPTLYADLLTGHGFDWESWVVCDGAFPPGPEAADGWLISGSRHGAYEDHEWIAPLERLIRAIVGAQRPLVGICFGHQIVAQALGGEVVAYPGGWAVGRRIYEGIEGRWALNAWHQDQVIEPPEGARTILRNDFTAHAGFRIGQGVLTLQPHPEFSNGYIADMLAEKGDALPPALVSEARAGIEAPTDTASAGALISDFFLDHRKTP